MLEDYTDGCGERIAAFVEHEHAKRHGQYEKEHEAEFVHLTHEDMAARMRDRDHVIDEIKRLTNRAPRRKDDPPDADWGRSVYSGNAEDNEMGDIRRFWRFGKWIVLTVAAPFLVALGDKLYETIF